MRNNHVVIALRIPIILFIKKGFL